MPRKELGRQGIARDTARVWALISPRIRRVITPETYYDSTDTDHTASIQAALDVAAVSGGTVALSPGKEYTISIPGDVGLVAAANVTIEGNGATIKVDDSQGNYYAIIGGASTIAGLSSADMSNFRMVGLTVDCNGANNTVSSPSDLTGNPRFIFVAYTGDNITVDGCTFKDIRATNAIAINGSSIDNVRITNNAFLTVGGGSVDFDHSSIYTSCRGAVIAGNRLFAASTNANGGRTAVETHGSGHVIANNHIRDFQIGMNVTGVDPVEDDVGITVANNSMRDVQYGILLWPYQSGSHISGYGLDGVTICGNAIYHSDPSNWASGTACNGITISTAGDLDIRNIIIADNVVYAPLESSSRTDSNTTIGIGWYSSEGQDVEGLIVADNLIINAPVAAIRVQCANISYSKIVGNEIVNPGSTQDAAVSNTYKAGIFVWATATIEGLDIDNNTIIDNLATSRMVYGIYVQAVTSADLFNIRWNVIKATGTTTTSLLYHILPASTTPKPFLVGNIDNWIIPTAYFAEGSQVIDPANGVTYHNSDGAGTWPAEGYGTAAPTSGTWARGSRVWTRTPSASGFLGWICVTAGSPGTWKQFGSISA